MNLYPVCGQCYFNNREPAICEECDNGSNFEEKIEQEQTQRGPTGKARTIKIHSRE